MPRWSALSQRCCLAVRQPGTALWRGSTAADPVSAPVGGAVY
jgi:hypothetical protein